MKEMLKSYAKINIGLKILEKRPDGYHDIDSYFHLIDLYDEIYPTVREDKTTKVSIEGNEIYLDKGVDIMEKAALAFSRESGRTFDLSIRIKKNIPSKAGLGGGSSNGAVVLRYLNTFFGNPFSNDELMSISLTVGSDLPFFISGYNAAHVKGRGELVEKVPPLSGNIDLFFPSFVSDTSEAYYKLDTLDRSYARLPESLEIITDERFPNDFELVIPRNTTIQRICEAYSYFSLSGSGSTYFGFNKKYDTKLAKSDIMCSVGTFLLS